MHAGVAAWMPHVTSFVTHRSHPVGKFVVVHRTETSTEESGEPRRAAAAAVPDVAVVFDVLQLMQKVRMAPGGSRDCGDDDGERRGREAALLAEVVSRVLGGDEPTTSGIFASRVNFVVYVALKAFVGIYRAAEHGEVPHSFLKELQPSAHSTARVQCREWLTYGLCDAIDAAVPRVAPAAVLAEAALNANRSAGVVEHDVDKHDDVAHRRAVECASRLQQLQGSLSSRVPAVTRPHPEEYAFRCQLLQHEGVCMAYLRTALQLQPLSWGDTAARAAAECFTVVHRGALQCQMCWGTSCGRTEAGGGDAMGVANSGGTTCGAESVTALRVPFAYRTEVLDGVAFFIEKPFIPFDLPRPRASAAGRPTPPAAARPGDARQFAFYPEHLSFTSLSLRRSRGRAGIPDSVTVDRLYLFTSLPSDFSTAHPLFSSLERSMSDLVAGTVLLLVESHVEAAALAAVDVLGQRVNEVLAPPPSSTTLTAIQVVFIASVGCVALRALARQFATLPNTPYGACSFRAPGDEVEAPHSWAVLRWIGAPKPAGRLIVRVYGPKHDEHTRTRHIGEGGRAMSRGGWLLCVSPLRTAHISDCRQHATRSAATVVFGGLTEAARKVVEYHFWQQYTHLVELLRPDVWLMPSAGVPETTLLAALRSGGPRVQLATDTAALHDGPVALLRTAVADAVQCYLELVLQRVGALSADDAMHEVREAIARVGCAPRAAENTAGQPTARLSLYDCAHILPRPALQNLVTTRNTSPGILLADVAEWETETEVFAAYSAVGALLQALLLYGVVGSCTDTGLYHSPSLL